jgi:RNA polymerase sigma-70 factor (ECF subfamily)
MAELSDAVLIARFRAGEGRALEALFARHEVSLYEFLVGVLRDHHQAEDAVQETFVRALEHLDGVDPEHLRGWLFTVAYRQALLARRRRKSRPAEPLAAGAVTDPDPGPLQTAAHRDDARRLRHLLDQLPAPQREVIRQRVFEGKRFREIAAALECPLNTALARMHEGLKRLRLLWGSDRAAECGQR